MDLSIIIVSYKVKEKLKENLHSIFSADRDFSLDVFVVDNNSQDGSVEMLKNDFPQVKLIDNKENLGFSKANNQALKLVHSKYVLLLNPDMRIYKDTLKNIYFWMEKNQNVSVAGIKLLNEKGEIIKHVRRFPTLLNQLAIVLKLPHIFKGILNSYIQDNFDYNKASLVDSVRGGFFMMNLENIRNKMNIFLDERYFIWFEEVDFCKQVRLNGGEVWYSPEAKCIDYVGQSFRQLDLRKKQNYFKDSQLKYFKKWHSLGAYYILKLAWVLSAFMVFGAQVFHIKSKTKT